MVKDQAVQNTLPYLVVTHPNNDLLIMGWLIHIVDK